ncbi:LuxR C-terminal-related transcriptional regulator [Aquabacterium sp. UBA2148]|jgi:transcriptional regulator EpsA|uniref:LuxR C-terminal-related transcriptional regulator n=1 Tax=Aquabacterium sp. UBA2148 TaxID=1946042 RepID=UPI002580A070|nr:LuxR C-terminal-related transcriptional regulator [Aquabacterium sp. UBA2148]
MTTTTIAPDQSEVLLRVIEAAPQVCRRHQFFVWTQGDFQRWLPHKLSLCGSYDRDQRELVFDLFNSLPMPDAVTRALRDRRSVLVSAALTSWQRGRGQAVVLDIRQLPAHDALVSELVALGYGRFIVHGLTRPGRPDEVESVFLFGQPGPDADDNARQALDMLLPCVHLAYQRVCVTERQMSQSRPGASAAINGVALRPSPITEREREILVWVRDGLSNQQISEKLGISALTVKNHVQKILRKLGAANRAQAVAKAMSMNALGAANFHLGESSV